MNLNQELSDRSPKAHPSCLQRRKVQLNLEEASLERGTERSGEVDQDTDTGPDLDLSDGGPVQGNGVEAEGSLKEVGADGGQDQGVGEGVAPSQEIGENGKITKKLSHH